MKLALNLVVVVIAACGRAPVAAAPQAPRRLLAESLPLPGADGPVALDYLFFDQKNARVWVPAGGTGSVDVLDVANGNFTRVQGFLTAERERHGRKRTVGPSAGAVGEGFAYIGNRATREVCAVDLKTLVKGSCVTLPAGTDGVEYVASAKEVWVTLPEERKIAVLDASKADVPAMKTLIKVDGAPEGYAVDERHGVFFTNLEDKGGTLVIGIQNRSVESTWNASCGPDGPRGLAFDATRDLLFVACTDHVQVLDAAHGGALLGKLDAGAGIDNIDYDATAHLLFIAAGKAGVLTVARVGERGQLAVVATGKTSEGARNAVTDGRGGVYVADSQKARVLFFKLPSGI